MVWKFPFSKTNEQESPPSTTNKDNNEYETKSYFHSYSSSKTCKKDPEDDNYMICKQIINDGNQTTERQQRYPVDRQNYFPNSQSTSFSGNVRNPFFNHQEVNINIHQFSSDLSKQVQEMDKMINQTFQSPLFALFGSNFINRPFASFDEEFNNINAARHQQPHSTRNYSRDDTKSKKSSSNYFFSHNKEKDYDIKDL